MNFTIILAIFSQINPLVLQKYVFDYGKIHLSCTQSLHRTEAFINCSKKIDETPPVLSVVPVDLSHLTDYIAFGGELSPNRYSPAFEYYLDNESAKVFSCCDGTVDRIMLNDNFPDYEVFIEPFPNSKWLVIYDHVKEVNFSAGDQVKAGDVLGIVGVGNRTELQINDNGNNKELSLCPFNFGTENFIQKHTNYTENWCLKESVVP